MKKVLSLGTDIYKCFSRFGQLCTDINAIFKRPKEISLVAFPGGADVNPELYGHNKHSRTCCSFRMDVIEKMVFDQARRNDIPCVGICRGGQFLTVMAGGYLYQDVTGHLGDHLAVTNDGNTMSVTSSHHQMFGWPLPGKAKVLMWSQHRRSRHYEIRDDQRAISPPIELEAVYYPEICSLAVQWHPEWMQKSSRGWKYYQYLLDTYIKQHTEQKYGIAV